MSAIWLVSSVLSGALLTALLAWLALALSATIGWSARNWRIRGR